MYESLTMRHHLTILYFFFFFLLYFIFYFSTSPVRCVLQSFSLNLSLSSHHIFYECISECIFVCCCCCCVCMLWLSCSMLVWVCSDPSHCFPFVILIILFYQRAFVVIKQNGPTEKNIRTSFVCFTDRERQVAAVKKQKKIKKKNGIILNLCLLGDLYNW